MESLGGPSPPKYFFLEPRLCPPIGPSSELTHAGRPYELTLLVSTVLVFHCADNCHVYFVFAYCVFLVCCVACVFTATISLVK